jgi:hypothetical protein
MQKGMISFSVDYFSFSGHPFCAKGDGFFFYYSLYFFRSPLYAKGKTRGAGGDARFAI